MKPVWFLDPNRKICAWAIMLAVDEPAKPTCGTGILIQFGKRRTRPLDGSSRHSSWLFLEPDWFHMRIWHICTQENPPMSKFYPEKLFSCQLPSPITLCFVPPLSPPPNLYNTMFKSVLVSSLLVSAGLCQRSQSMWGQCKHPILSAVLPSPVGCLSNHNAPQKVAAVITPEQRHVPLPHTAGMTG